MKAPRWLARLAGSAGPAEMSLLDHLDELRSVLLSCLWALLLLTAVAWFFSGRLLDLLVARTVGEAQFIRPLEGFSTRFMLSLLLAVVAGLPFYSAQIWGFILPGLLHRERRLVRPIAFWSATLFLAGLAFSSLVLTPTMIRILTSFGSEHVRAQISVGYLFDFFFKMGLACGLLFQLPLVVAVLSFVGLVSSRFLLSKWRHAIVLILIVAAIVTPGDGPSQLILAVPIVVLYFISIWIAVAIERGRRRRAAEEEAERGLAAGPEGARTEPPEPDAAEQAPGVPEDSAGQAPGGPEDSAEQPPGAEKSEAGPPENGGGTGSTETGERGEAEAGKAPPPPTGEDWSI